MCLIGADVKVNVIAPHFGEGELPDFIIISLIQYTILLWLPKLY
jgi:hypothetical protein